MRTTITRRRFLTHAGHATLGGSLLGVSGLGAEPAASGALPEPTPQKLPRWRGFNLLEKFNGRNERFLEQDFEWMAELGFNFVRLPMDYRAWIDGGDWTKFREQTLEEIGQAIGYGAKHGIHVCLNFHRAPGYTVAQPPEPKPVWTDDEALRVCALHWAKFAERFRGLPNRQVSFNLFNEPGRVEPAAHRKVIARLAEAIREEDSRRLIICDGREWGNAPPEELKGLEVAAATRGYEPFKITHYQASWVQNRGQWELPDYPLKDGATVWDKAMLRSRKIAPWQKLEGQGFGVMVGEFGAFNKTPHRVVLPWMRDCLALWQEAGWGWALWNFRGAFGVLDSGRADVAYEEWRGHQLDRAMLDLLRS